jgi:hypothetical protein
MVTAKQDISSYNLDPWVNAVLQNGTSKSRITLSLLLLNFSR